MRWLLSGETATLPPSVSAPDLAAVLDFGRSTVSGVGWLPARLSQSESSGLGAL